MAIGRLERFVADWEAEEGAGEAPPLPPLNGRHVAVVGSGPAGITVAADLALLGYEVTVFEALHEAGGVLTYGIPEFRLPKAIVRREVAYVRSLGVELRLDYVVGKTRTIDRLLGSFDAVFVGAGAGLPWFLEIPGENLNGVYSANEYLTRCNLMRGFRFPAYDTPLKRPARVAVFGGGNVAMDSARTALRLGADEVHIVYRRSRAELPARARGGRERRGGGGHLRLPHPAGAAHRRRSRLALRDRVPAHGAGRARRLRASAPHRDPRLGVPPADGCLGVRHRQQPQPADPHDDARSRGGQARQHRGRR